MSSISDLIGQCSEQDRQAVLKAAWIVAFSDGRLYAEKSQLQQIGNELGLNFESARQVEQAVRNGSMALSVPVPEVARRVMYHYALQMIAADGKIRSAEQEIALHLGDALGLSHDQIQVELNALTSQEKSDRKKRTQQSFQHLVPAEHKTLKNLLVAIGGQNFAESSTVSFLLTRQSVLIVILTNLIPVFGVIFFDWRVFTIVFLYWLENIIIGFFNIAKMVTASIYERRAVSLLIVPFFTIHYGGFVFVHGVFVFALFNEQPGDHLFEGFTSEFTLGIVLALISLTFEHAYLFYTTFLQTGRHKSVESVVLLFAPYPRIVVLHVSLLFGALLIEALQMRFLVLVILIPLKIIIDLVTLRMMEKSQRQKSLL